MWKWYAHTCSGNNLQLHRNTLLYKDVWYHVTCFIFTNALGAYELQFTIYVFPLTDIDKCQSSHWFHGNCLTTKLLLLSGMYRHELRNSYFLDVFPQGLRFQLNNETNDTLNTAWIVSNNSLSKFAWHDFYGNGAFCWPLLYPYCSGIYVCITLFPLKIAIVFNKLVYMAATWYHVLYGFFFILRASWHRPLSMSTHF